MVKKGEAGLLDKTSLRLYQQLKFDLLHKAQTRTHYSNKPSLIGKENERIPPLTTKGRENSLSRLA